MPSTETPRFEHGSLEDLPSYRSSSSQCLSHLCSSRDAGCDASTKNRAVSSRSTTCDDASVAAAWTPPLGSQDARVPEHAGGRGGVEERYRIQPRHAGAGGFGQVFLADDREVPGRRVAIKKISLTNPSNRQSYNRERSVSKLLDHPCICRILETYESSHSGHVVLELCEGGDAFDRLADVGNLAEAAAASVLAQVASALRYAHARGIAHRDVKPENICYCSHDAADQRVKLIDWGTAFKFREGKMRSYVGSAAYAAPETAPAAGGGLAEEYTEACDLWSLGVTAYVLLSGMPPFWGDREEQLRRMRAEQFPLKGKPWDTISEVAKDFVRSLLRADPTQRLSAEAALGHPFLQQHWQPALDHDVARQAFENMRRFECSSSSLASYAVQVARHLDHASLRPLQQVFHALDTNGAGELSRGELRRGFEEVFGADGEELRNVDAQFVRLDLDGSGSLSFAEFCAVSLGGQLTAPDESLKAAFRDFGVQERCRQDLLAAASALAAEEPGEKPRRRGLAAWLRAARQERRRGRPLDLLRPAGELDADPPRASFYNRLCCLVSGRRRRSEISRQPLVDHMLAPLNFGNLGGMTTYVPM